MQKKGVLFIQLGTPCAPTWNAVRIYLQEFLSDPYVISLPFILRKALVSFYIAPFRALRSAKAYQKIWLAEGSPLQVYSQKMTEAVSAILGPSYEVALGMRYQKPSLWHALEKLQDCHSILIVPLFPHYAESTNTSAINYCFNYFKKKKWIPALTIYNQFYDQDFFIKAYAQKMEQFLKGKKLDHLILSYHGLPQSRLQSQQCKGKCKDPCPPIQRDTAFCYKAQCYTTSRLLMEHLSFYNSVPYSACFQSRLGYQPWIQPYLKEYLVQLIQKDIRDIALVCPSFVADCLETLEEIDISIKNFWYQLGGRTFYRVPCLNADPLWIQSLSDKIQQSHV